MLGTKQSRKGRSWLVDTGAEIKVLLPGTLSNMGTTLKNTASIVHFLSVSGYVKLVPIYALLIILSNKIY